jgi:hypothetical protein
MALARRKEASTMTPPAATRQATAPKPKRKRAPNRTLRPAASEPAAMPPVHPTLDRALRELLHRVDFPDAEILTYDDLHHWGDEVAKTFVSAGLVMPAGLATEIPCPECGDGTMVRVERVAMGDRIVATCWGRDKPHRIAMAIGRIQFWRFDLAGLARLVAENADALGSASVVVPDRLVHAGSIAFRGSTHELFIARGIAWTDARSTIADADRLRMSPLAVVLAVGAIPPFGVWRAQQPALGEVTQVIRWTAGGATARFDSLATQEVVAHPSCSSGDWLTVTDAARRLADVRSGLDLRLARARVSRAASASKFRTNGELGLGRRVHSPSFSLWLLEQREIDLREQD